MGGNVLSTPTASSLHRPTLVIGAALLALAFVTWRDASTMQIRAGYGMGADAASYFVAAFLALMGAGHILAAFRWQGDASPSDWKAVGWVALGLGSLVAALWFGAGFILGSTLLFAFTARAFGRKAFPADLALGFVLATVIFLLFNKLLTLALPMGPFERLF
ncbi:tripartite tricarboxylate transporter TctB family protein [Paracoccus denitrificans]|jgi:putative tricarboxylic transport membrane protein|uniref:Tripartite tricarboxylate transporter TctB family protein n=1 Tax=Paracoccus pantotrophus TaxID=82367 RepID=A0A7H9BYN9_PARPN|nr:tripartite tricarboxylate transporter TctB family protein [Paracoccus denitrificans]QLH14931.1 tripartite tricarboxylate transporter TctB family protein [Paracoccus pantotrophus]